MEFNRNQFLILGVVLLFFGLQFKKVESFTLNERASRLLNERFSACGEQRRHDPPLPGLDRPDAAPHDPSARMDWLCPAVGRIGAGVAQPGHEKTRRLALRGSPRTAA